MGEKPISLRERKKRRTRHQLIEVSTRLFAEQGYDQTTLEQIANEVEVSVQTLLAYFPSKDRLATIHEWDAVDRLRRRLEDPERRDDTLTIWRASVENAATQVTELSADYRKRSRTLLASPSLRAAWLEIPYAFEEALAAGFARDFGTDTKTDLQAHLLAAMLSFGNQRVVLQWVDADGATDLVAQVTAVVDFATEHFPQTRAAADPDRISPS